MAPPRDPNDDEGMIDAPTFARQDAVRQKADADEKAQNEADQISPTLTKDRLRQYKDTARKMIDERLANRRRQRRLMRGGSAPQ